MASTPFPCLSPDDFIERLNATITLAPNIEVAHQVFMDAYHPIADVYNQLLGIDTQSLIREDLATHCNRICNVTNLLVRMSGMYITAMLSVLVKQAGTAQQL